MMRCDCQRLSVFQFTVEMEAKLDQLRSMVEAADRDKVELLNQLEEEKRCVVAWYWIQINAVCESAPSNLKSNTAGRILENSTQ